MTHSPKALPAMLTGLPSVFAREPIQFAILFGSAGRGEPFHDLDLAVLYHPGHGSLPSLLELGVKLESAAGVWLDLVSIAEATTAFQFEVSKGVALFGGDSDAYFDWKERTWNDYFAIQHFLENHALEYARAFEQRSHGRSQP
jgi:predicted nucleotidyltransferase